MAYTGTQAIAGLATTFEASTTSSGTFVLISEIKSITQSGATNKTADCTNLESTAEEFICVIPSSGKFELECNRVFADAGQAMLLASFAAATTLFYKVTTPDTTVYSFKAIVEEFESLPKVSPNDILTVKIGLKVSGPITT